MGRPGRAAPYLLLAVVTWAAAFPAIRRSVEELSPGELVVGRLLVASAALAVLLAPRLRRNGVPPVSDLWALFVVGLLGVSGYQLLLNTGAQTVSASTAAVLVNLAPVVAALFAPVLLGERLAGRQWVGVALAFGGSVAVSATEGGAVRLTWGAGAVFASAVVAGFFVLRQKPLLDRYDAIEVTAWATVLSTIPTLVFLPSFANAAGSLDASVWASLLWLGLGSSVVGYLAWAAGLGRSDATAAAMWLYLVPPVAALLAWWWIGERPGLSFVVGGSVALFGVWLATGQSALRSSAVAHPEEA